MRKSEMENSMILYLIQYTVSWKGTCAIRKYCPHVAGVVEITSILFGIVQEVGDCRECLIEPRFHIGTACLCTVV